LWLCDRYPVINKVGAVVMAYITGLVLGNSGLILPEEHDIQAVLSTATIPIAIPLMLFSIKLKECVHLAKKGIVSMLIGIGSVVVLVFTGYFLFQGKIAEMWKIGGLLIGVYTGGTPNLASLKLMLDVEENLYLVTHASDMLISAFYLLFLLTFGQRFFDQWLLKGQREEKKISEIGSQGENELFWGLLKRKNFRPLIQAFGLAALILVAGGGFSLLVPSKSQMVVAILSITTLGLTAAFSPRVNQLPKTFELGMYLVLIFSVVVASMVKFSDLFKVPPFLFFYIAYVIFGSLILQLLFSKLFKIDTDTMIVTSTALICSPPFVPLIAAAINNRKVVVVGLTIGLIGYAIGNYLGFLVAEILRGL